MSSSLIITDTCSDLPIELTDNYNIEILANTFQIDGKYFVEGVDFTPENFYEILPAKSMQITSVYIPAAVFLDRYKNAASCGYENVFVILAGPSTIPMHESAKEAKILFNEQNPTSDMKIEIIDSGVYSMANGLIVLNAGKLVAQKADYDTIMASIQENIKKATILVDAFHVPKLSADPTRDWDKRIKLKSYHPFPALKIRNSAATELPILKGDHSAFDQFYAHCLEALKSNKSEYAIGYASRKNEARAIATLLEEDLGYPPIALYKLGAISAHSASKAAIYICYMENN